MSDRESGNGNGRLLDADPPPAPVVEKANMIQLSPEPGTTVWDAAIHFQDGFTLMVDRWPHPDPLGRICVPPQRLRIEGYVGGVKMFAATVNLTGGTQIAPR